MARRRKKPLRRGHVPDEEIKRALRQLSPKAARPEESPGRVGPPRNRPKCGKCGDDVLGSRIRATEDDPWQCFDCYMGWK